MDGYQELLQAIADAAAAIFAEAKTETEVCELEQAIYEEINQVAATRIAELSAGGCPGARR